MILIFSLETCSETNGDTLVNTLSQLLQLGTEFSDCAGVVNYYKNEHGLEDTAVCNTLIDTVVENLPGTNAQKDQIRLAYPGVGIDQSTTLTSDFCHCTCSIRK